MKIIIADRVLSIEEIVLPQSVIDAIHQHLVDNSIEYIQNDEYDENLSSLAYTIINDYIVPHVRTVMPNLKELVTWHNSFEFFDFLNCVLENQPYDSSIRLIFDVKANDTIVVKYLDHLEKWVENLELDRGKILSCAVTDPQFATARSVNITIGSITINHSDLLDFYTKLILDFYVLLSQIYSGDKKDLKLVDSYKSKIQPAVTLTATVGKRNLKDLLFAGGKSGLLISQMSSIIQFIQTTLTKLPKTAGPELTTYIGKIR